MSGKRIEIPPVGDEKHLVQKYSISSQHADAGVIGEDRSTVSDNQGGLDDGVEDKHTF